MRTTSRLRLALPIAVLAVVASVLVSACSTFSGPAWQVGDKAVGVDQFYEDFEASQVDQAASASTTSSDRFATAELAEFMTNQIRQEILAQALADKGVTVTDEDRQNAEDAILQQSESSGQPVTPTEDQIDNQASITALGTALVKAEIEAGTFDLDAEVRRLFDENESELPPTPGETCFHVIFIAAVPPEEPATTVPTDEQRATALAAADAAVARVATEDFETVAAEVSILEEQFPGGDFGCVTEAELNPELVALLEPLAPGTVGPPTYLEADRGYVIVRLDSRTAETPATFEAYEQDITAFAIQQRSEELVQAQIEDLIDDAVVVVDPRFGAWNTETLVVDPPDGAATPTTPTTALTGLPPELEGLGIDPSQLEQPGS